jgi:hypothetical protein
MPLLLDADALGPVAYGLTSSLGNLVRIAAQRRVAGEIEFSAPEPLRAIIPLLRGLCTVRPR